MNIKNLIQVVILYGIYETSQGRYHDVKRQ